jgi:hypothetical protein
MCTTGKPSASPEEESATGRPDRDPLATQDNPAKFLTQDSRTTGDGSARSTVEVLAEELGQACGGRRLPRPGPRAARTSSRLDQRYDGVGAKHASVPLRRVHAVEGAGRLFSTPSRPALRAASGPPPARQRHDGHRGTGLTLTTRVSQSSHGRRGTESGAVVRGTVAGTGGRSDSRTGPDPD